MTKLTKIVGENPELKESTYKLTKEELIQQMFKEYKVIQRKDSSLKKLTRINFIKEVIVDLDAFQSAYNRWVVSDYKDGLKPILILNEEPRLMNDANFQKIWSKYVADHKLEDESEEILISLKRNLAKQAELILGSKAYKKTLKKSNGIIDG